MGERLSKLKRATLTGAAGAAIFLSGCADNTSPEQAGATTIEIGDSPEQLRIADLEAAAFDAKTRILDLLRTEGAQVQGAETGATGWGPNNIGSSSPSHGVDLFAQYKGPDNNESTRDNTFIIGIDPSEGHGGLAARLEMVFVPRSDEALLAPGTVPTVDALETAIESGRAKLNIVSVIETLSDDEAETRTCIIGAKSGDLVCETFNPVGGDDRPQRVGSEFSAQLIADIQNVVNTGTADIAGEDRPALIEAEINPVADEVEQVGMQPEEAPVEEIDNPEAGNTIEALEQHAETFALEAAGTFPSAAFANASEDGDNSPTNNAFTISQENGGSALQVMFNTDSGEITVFGSYAPEDNITETYSVELQATPSNYIFNEFLDGDGPINAGDFQKALSDPESLELIRTSAFSETAGEVQARIGPDGLQFTDPYNGDMLLPSDPAAQTFVEQASSLETFDKAQAAILAPLR